MRALLLAAPLALAACSGGGSQDEAAAPVDVGRTAPIATSFYQTEIEPVLTGRCATCHLTGQEAGNMSLVPGKALASLVDVEVKEAPGLRRVVPGDPGASYLIMKLEGTQLAHGGAGAQMPFGAPPLPAPTIAKFRQWIAEGAKP